MSDSRRNLAPGAASVSDQAASPSESDIPTVTLYGRPFCHLCDEMAAELDEMRSTLAFNLVIVDVDSDPALAKRFGPFIPVLMLDDLEICHYHFDPQRFAGLLSGNNNA